MLKRITETNTNMIPIKRDPNATRVEGIEKYLSSLKIEITVNENVIPRIVKIIPGIPIIKSGRLIAISSHIHRH